MVRGPEPIALFFVFALASSPTQRRKKRTHSDSHACLRRSRDSSVYMDLGTRQGCEAEEDNYHKHEYMLSRFAFSALRRQVGGRSVETREAT
jgi:hypothetical protein